MTSPAQKSHAYEKVVSQDVRRKPSFSRDAGCPGAVRAISRRDWFPTPAQAQFMTILRAQCEIVASGA
jgi:hypothetical protein